MVSDQVVIALVTTFGSVISGLLVKVLSALTVLQKDVDALKTHLGVQVKNGLAIPLESKNGSGKAYEANP